MVGYQKYGMIEIARFKKHQTLQNIITYRTGFIHDYELPLIATQTYRFTAAMDTVTDRQMTGGPQDRIEILTVLSPSLALSIGKGAPKISVLISQTDKLHRSPHSHLLDEREPRKSTVGRKNF
jgi:hypothetical protein